MGQEGGLRLLTALAVDATELNRVNRVNRVSALEVGGGRILTPGTHPSLLFAIDSTRHVYACEMIGDMCPYLILRVCGALELVKFSFGCRNRTTLDGPVVPSKLLPRCI